ncbi:MAG: Rab family GTPase [Candidatus Heimdallarchaeota archaeon]
MSVIKREFVFKVVLMGEGSVGKTSIRSKFMGVGFKSEYIKTIGADFASKAIIVGDNKVHFQIWDLAGQKMYRHVRSSFYSGCKCGFLVFDLTQPQTLEDLNEWVDEAIDHSGGFVKIFIVIGNKVDLKDQIKVKQKDVDKLIKRLNDYDEISAAYITTSAKTGENINEAFEKMGKMFLDKEGFPRKGHGSEIDDEILLKHHQEIKPLITVPSAPSKKSTEPGNETSITSELESDEVQEVISIIMEKINQLSQITLALEERLLLVETKKVSGAETVADINEIREKIVGLEHQLDKFSIAIDNVPEGKATASFPKVDSSLTIPVPSVNDLETSMDSTDEAIDDSAFDLLDRTILETMTIIEGNEDEASITEILAETEKEVEVTEETIDEIKEEKKPEDKKEPKSPTRCPKCGSKLSFIKQYNRWYCYRCKIYV